jgi:hypothetical protein
MRSPPVDVQARPVTTPRLLLRFLHRIPRRAEDLLDLRVVDDPGPLLTLRLAPRALAHDRRHVALEVSQPGLARVPARDEAEHFVGELDVLVGDPVLLEQPREQVAPRDLDLLFDGVPRDANDLHAVAQGRRDVEQVVRGADEER